MRHCKDSQRSQSHSVKLSFAPFLGKNSGFPLLPNQRLDIKLSKSLKKNVVCDHSFSFGQLLVPENHKILTFLTEVKMVSLTLP